MQLKEKPTQLITWRRSYKEKLYNKIKSNRKYFVLPKTYIYVIQIAWISQSGTIEFVKFCCVGYIQFCEWIFYFRQVLVQVFGHVIYRTVGRNTPAEINDSSCLLRNVFVGLKRNLFYYFYSRNGYLSEGSLYLT